MYTRILVPVDGSETSLKGLDEAIRLAVEHGSSVRVVHVLHKFPSTPGHAGHGSFSSARDKLRLDGEQLLQQCRERALRAGIASVDTSLVASLLVGLVDQIADEARQWKADLIVAGTRGRKGIERILWGSEAHDLLSSTTIPVLLVHAPEQSSAG